MPTRFDVERAIEDSDLSAVSRHVCLTLCRRMESGSTLIPPQYSPSLARLARATGLHRRTLMRHLARLEADGWIIRRRPTSAAALQHHRTTHYIVAIPQPGTDSPGSRGGKPSDPGADSPEPRGSMTHIQSKPDHDPEIDLVMEELRKRTGKSITAEWAAKTRDLILARPGVNNRLAYLRRVLTTDPDPARFLPTSQPPPVSEVLRRPDE